MLKKVQLKGIFITEDGENFLCIRQLYVNDLCTGKLLDGKIYQGRRFKLIEDKTNDKIKDVSRDHPGSNKSCQG